MEGTFPGHGGTSGAGRGWRWRLGHGCPCLLRDSCLTRLYEAQPKGPCCHHHTQSLGCSRQNTLGQNSLWGSAHRPLIKSSITSTSPPHSDTELGLCLVFTGAAWSPSYVGWGFRDARRCWMCKTCLAEDRGPTSPGARDREEGAEMRKVLPLPS